MYDECFLSKFRSYYHVRPNEAGHFAIKKKKRQPCLNRGGEKTSKLSRGGREGIETGVVISLAKHIDRVDLVIIYCRHEPLFLFHRCNVNKPAIRCLDSDAGNSSVTFRVGGNDRVKRKEKKEEIREREKIGGIESMIILVKNRRTYSETRIF